MTLFEARHITASYPREGHAVQLFSDVSFSLEEATIYDLVGPSGSGKSTLLRVCALMLARDGGELSLDGHPSGAFAPTRWRRDVCLVPQKPALVPGTVRDNLILPWTLKVHEGQVVPEDAALQVLLDRAELTGIDLSRDVSQLSGGQAARVALLRVFATKPKVLLLDEVDAALDNDSALSIGRLTHSLVDRGMTCLRIRHRAADGFALGVFELKGGALAYRTYVSNGPPVSASSEVLPLKVAHAPQVPHIAHAPSGVSASLVGNSSSHTIVSPSQHASLGDLA